MTPARLLLVRVPEGSIAWIAPDSFSSWRYEAGTQDMVIVPPPCINPMQSDVQGSQCEAHQQDLALGSHKECHTVPADLPLLGASGRPYACAMQLEFSDSKKDSNSGPHSFAAWLGVIPSGLTGARSREAAGLTVKLRHRVLDA